MEKYGIEKKAHTAVDGGGVIVGIIKEYLGDGWYLVRVDGIDERWHEDIIDYVEE